MTNYSKSLCLINTSSSSWNKKDNIQSLLIILLMLLVAMRVVNADPNVECSFDESEAIRRSIDTGKIVADFTNKRALVADRLYYITDTGLLPSSVKRNLQCLRAQMKSTPGQPLHRVERSGIALRYWPWGYDLKFINSNFSSGASVDGNLGNNYVVEECVDRLRYLIQLAQYQIIGSRKQLAQVLSGDDVQYISAIAVYANSFLSNGDGGLIAKLCTPAGRPSRCHYAAMWPTLTTIHRLPSTSMIDRNNALTTATLRGHAEFTIKARLMYISTILSRLNYRNSTVKQQRIERLRQQFPTELGTSRFRSIVENENGRRSPDMFIAFSDDTAIISFKGVSSGHDWWLSAQCSQLTVRGSCGMLYRLHSGFALGYMVCLQDWVDEQLNRFFTKLIREKRSIRRIMYVGYSFGGPMATLAAAHLIDRYIHDIRFKANRIWRRLIIGIRSKVIVVTVGSPPVGDGQFKQFYDSLGIDHINYVGASDLVPWVWEYLYVLDSAVSSVCNNTRSLWWGKLLHPLRATIGKPMEMVGDLVLDEVLSDQNYFLPKWWDFPIRVLLIRKSHSLESYVEVVQNITETLPIDRLLFSGERLRLYSVDKQGYCLLLTVRRWWSKWHRSTPPRKLACSAEFTRQQADRFPITIETVDRDRVTVPGRLVAFGASVVMRLIDKHNRNAITNNSIILTRKKSWFSTDIVETPCKPPAAMKKSAAISSVAVAHAVEQQPCLINRKGLWLIEPSSDRNLNRKKGRRRYERIVFASDGSVEVIFKAAGWRTISGWTDVRDGVWHPIAGYKKVRNASVFRLEKI